MVELENERIVLSAVDAGMGLEVAADESVRLLLTPPSRRLDLLEMEITALAKVDPEAFPAPPLPPSPVMPIESARRQDVLTSAASPERRVIRNGLGRACRLGRRRKRHISDPNADR